MPVENEKEKAVRDQRMIQAAKSDLCGLEGKFGRILRVFGQPVMVEREGGTFTDLPEGMQIEFVKTPMPDFSALDDDDMPTAGENQSINVIGYHYDGLPSGRHLEIVYWMHEKHLKVSHRGYVVYEEVENELVRYIPHPAWEQIIDAMMVTVVRREAALKPLLTEAQKADRRREKTSLLERLRLMWGV